MQRKHLMLSTLALLASCARQPDLAGAPALARTVSLTVDLPPARELQSVARRWTAANIYLYRVKLQRYNGTSYVDTGLTQDVRTTALNSAVFTNLAGGAKYQANVQAWGNATGTAADTPLNAGTPCNVVYDFTGQDVAASLSRTATITLDPVGFSGVINFAFSNEPAGIATETVSLFKQGNPTPVAVQTLSADASGCSFSGLALGGTYSATATAFDASGISVGTAASDTMAYADAPSVEQVSSLDLNFHASNPTFAAFPTSAGPAGVAIDASGYAWVTNYSDNSVSRLTSTGGMLNVVQYGGYAPRGVAVDRTNGHVWVANSSGNRVSELTSGGGVIGSFTVGLTPWGVAIDASGNVWVANSYSNYVSELSSAGAPIATFTSGTAPHGIAVSSTGNVWVANFGSNTVTRISPTLHTTLDIPVGNTPEGITVDSNGHVWVTNSGSNTVTMLADLNGSLLGTFSVGATPYGIAADNNGHVWVANSGSNSVTELSSSGGVIGSFSVGTTPWGVAVDSGGHVWVANHGSNTLSRR